MRNYSARVPASLYSEASRFHIAGEARRELGAGYEKISSKLNERGRVLVPSFGSADRSEISKKFLSWPSVKEVGAGVAVQLNHSFSLQENGQIILSMRE